MHWIFLSLLIIHRIRVIATQKKRSTSILAVRQILFPSQELQK